jgi:nicotinate-nucleotide pyrophosphorylase (carboxylating)
MVDPLVLPPRAVIVDAARRALAEDVGTGDATAALLPADGFAHAQVIAKEAGVIAGAAWFDACMHEVDARIVVRWDVPDGGRVAPNTRVCAIEGPVRGIVTGERSALNFLQTLSGTATTAAEYVAAVAGTGATVLDTRKTLPGLRLAQKYAVRCGGARNHRIGLFDAVLIKENHIAASGGIAQAVAQARAHTPNLPLEVEVESIDELRTALAAGVRRIMLDDFSDDDMRDAVAIARGQAELEVSGSVTLQRIRAIAETGVHYISVGALTKHVRALDLSLRLLA